MVVTSGRLFSDVFKALLAEVGAKKDIKKKKKKTSKQQTNKQTNTHTQAGQSQCVTSTTITADLLD